MKKKFSVLLAGFLAICITSAVWGANFSDINQVPWEGAKTYINSVADAGLMVGDEDIRTGAKIFRANDNVTYCEVTQLAYTLLSSTGKLATTADLTTKWSAVMASYKIPAWAYKSVSYALEYGIISVSDASKFMSSSGANVDATREGVAVIMGKALGGLYSVNSSASLSYADKANIAATSVPYVDLLTRLNIMVGDDENKFNPKTDINRAEMAVVVSKTYDLLKNNTSTPSTNTGSTTTGNTTNSASGTVTAVDDMGGTYMISIMTTDGSRGFIGTDDVNVVNGSNTVKFSSIEVGDTITVDYTGSAINKVTITYDKDPNNSSSSAGSYTVEGEIKSMTNSKISLKISSSRTETYYFYSDENEISIKLDGSSNKDIDDLMDFYEDNDSVEVKLTLNKNDYIIGVVATSDDSDSSTVKGEVTNVTSTKITIKKSSSSKETFDFYDDGDDVDIKLDGKSNKDVDDLKDFLEDNDYVYATITLNDDDEVTKVVATSDEDDDDDDTIKGRVDYVNNRYIELKNKSTTYYFYDDGDDVDVRLGGKSNKDVDDLIDFVDDNDDVYVTLTLNSDDEVTKVVATSDDDDDTDEYAGEISSLSSSSIKISGEGTFDFDDVDDVDVSVEDGTEESKIKDYDDLKEAYDEGKIMEVTITVDSDDYVTDIEGRVIRIEDARVNSIDVDDKTIKLKIRSSSSSTSTYAYEKESYVDIEIDGDDDVSMSDLEDTIDEYNTDVTIELDDEGYIVEIIAETD